MIIKELKLYTKDIGATKAFYHNGMQLRVANESATEISFIAGSTLLKFEEYTQAEPFYHIAFGIPSNQLQEALHWVSLFTGILPYSGAQLTASFTAWNARAFYFHDNNGNILECIAHFDLGLQSSIAFNSGSILGICEAGIVADDVAATTTMLNEQYGIPYFSKGPRLSDFAVMGDAHGMFIVSKKGRGWLPTQRPAEYFPLTTLIKTGNEIFTIKF